MFSCYPQTTVQKNAFPFCHHGTVAQMSYSGQHGKKPMCILRVSFVTLASGNTQSDSTAAYVQCTADSQNTEELSTGFAGS